MADRDSPTPARIGADGDERPPGLPTWRAWYALVLGTLAALIALFTLLSRLS